MQYFKTYLTEIAEIFISKIKITAESYWSTWNQLLGRYDNPQLFLKSYIVSSKRYVRYLPILYRRVSIRYLTPLNNSLAHFPL